MRWVQGTVNGVYTELRDGVPWVLTDGDTMDCILCGEEMGLLGEMDPSTYHGSCMLRETLGGIGHLIAHPYWCDEMHDPDAGLTRRQSAIMVQCLFNTIGVEAAVSRYPT